MPQIPPVAMRQGGFGGGVEKLIRQIPEMIPWHKALFLRLLPSGPDLVRTASFHEVPGDISLP